MLGRKSLIVLVSRVLASLLALVGMIFTARYLGPEIYGQVAWAMALVATFNSISDFGFSAAHIKRVSEGKDIDDCVSTFIVIKILLTVAMVVVVVSYIAILYLGMNSISQTDVDVLLLMVAYYVFANMTSVVWVTFEARTESVKSNLVYIADPLFRTPLMIFVAVNHMGATALALTYVGGGIGMAVVGWIIFSREHFRFKRPTFYRNYFVYASAIALITIFGTVSWNLDKLVIEAFGDVTDVGFYSSSQTLLGVVGFIGVAVTSLTFPTFSRMHREGNIQGIREICKLAERYISILGTPMIVVIMLFPSEIILLFLGPSFLPSADAMRILAISTYISLLTNAYTPQIGGTNRPDITAKLVGVNLLLNIILLLMFVPTTLAGVPMLGLGFVGAAIANAIVALSLGIMVRVTVYRLTKTPFNPRILRHFVAGALSAMVLLALAQLVSPEGLVHLMLFSILEIEVFLAFLILLGELTWGDFNYFLDVMNPKAMVSYMKDEMSSKK